MKEFIWNLVQKVGNYFFPQHEKQVRTKSEKVNGNTQKLQCFLHERFEFRYNRLTGVTEYRSKGIADATFSPVDERKMNGMIVDARLKGIVCWNSMVPTLVLSDKVEDYHPFHLYMDELPLWDGIDRVSPLLRRVSDDALWLSGGRYWLRALTAQWMGLERTHAKTLVPVLVSSEQGLGKSSFCRSLLPDSLRAYYLDNLNLSPGSSPEKKLVKTGIINLDEFDKISEKRQPDLKNLLQMMSVPVYRGKRLGYVTEPRLASFIATTNSRQILSDPTGSRRFLCVEVTDMISEDPIEHKQLYAQLKQEVLNGERDYLNKEEARACNWMSDCQFNFRRRVLGRDIRYAGNAYRCNWSKTCRQINSKAYLACNVTHRICKYADSSAGFDFCIRSARRLPLPCADSGNR